MLGKTHLEKIHPHTNDIKAIMKITLAKRKMQVVYLAPFIL